MSLLFCLECQRGTRIDSNIVRTKRFFIPFFSEYNINADTNIEFIVGQT